MHISTHLVGEQAIERRARRRSVSRLHKTAPRHGAYDRHSAVRGFIDKLDQTLLKRRAARAHARADCYAVLSSAFDVLVRATQAALRRPRANSYKLPHDRTTRYAALYTIFS